MIGSFALQRRVIARYEDYPKVLRDAVISIEDKDFERHWGIDLWRIMGAAYRDITSGSRAQGASTLTMQLSRNLFLSPDRKFGRKLQEVILAIQIERRFTKEQIFTLYANQIFLGHGVYGFEAGSEFYFSKPAKELTIDEAALLAGLPKGPSAYSPINNPEKALRRRNLVINNMMEDGRITAQQAQEAKSRPLNLRLQSEPNAVAPVLCGGDAALPGEKVRARPGARGRIAGLYLAGHGIAEDGDPRRAGRTGGLRAAARMEGACAST